ncbi:hypothetical protein Plhal304r1_c035g0108091 [Plasmopara halstedii]
MVKGTQKFSIRYCKIEESLSRKVKSYQALIPQVRATRPCIAIFRANIQRVSAVGLP